MPHPRSGRADQGMGGSQSLTLATRVNATDNFTSADLPSDGFSLAAVTLDMTSAGTGSVSLFVEGKDPASGKYFVLGSYATIIANATKTVLIGPGIATTATTDNNYFNGWLPPLWRVRAVANNANPTSYTLGASLTW